MSKKKKFTIGQLVVVDPGNRVVPEYDNQDNRKVIRYRDASPYYSLNREQVKGMITGVRIFKEGKYYPEKGTIRFDGDCYEPAYLVPKNGVTTWAVRLGYRNKELYFLEEDIKPLEVVGLNEDIPYFYQPFPKEWRERVSAESKIWPRDEKGRWAK